MHTIDVASPLMRKIAAGLPLVGPQQSMSSTTNIWHPIQHAWRKWGTAVLSERCRLHLAPVQHAWCECAAMLIGIICTEGRLSPLLSAPVLLGRVSRQGALSTRRCRRRHRHHHNRCDQRRQGHRPPPSLPPPSLPPLSSPAPA